MISVFINGTPQTFEPQSRISDLLDRIDLVGKRIAIECNGQIVPRSMFSQHLLGEGDKIEVVVAVGGG